MATIKRSEVERLRREPEALRSILRDVVADRDYWLDDSWNWKQKATIASVRTNEFRNKLWAAEQEIHDLKVALERQRTNALNVLVKQELEIKNLVNWCIDLLVSPAPIDVPACLNGYDALKWSTARAYEPNSGPY